MVQTRDALLTMICQLVGESIVFTSGQPPLSSGRKASSPGTVAISL